MSSRQLSEAPANWHHGAQRRTLARAALACLALGAVLAVAVAVAVARVQQREDASELEIKDLSKVFKGPHAAELEKMYKQVIPRALPSRDAGRAVAPTKPPRCTPPPTVQHAPPNRVERSMPVR
jgi:hypothetical protein